MVSAAPLGFLWCVDCASSPGAVVAEAFRYGSIHAMHSNSSHHHHHNSTSDIPYHHAHASSLSPLMKTVILLSVYAILAASILLICCWHIQVQEAGKRYYYARIDDPNRSRLPSGSKDAALPPLPSSSKKRSSSRQYQTDDSSDDDDFTSDVERGIALHDYHSVARGALSSSSSAARSQRDLSSHGRSAGGPVGDAESNRPPLHPPLATPTTAPTSSRQFVPLGHEDHRANAAAPIVTPRTPVDDTSPSGEAQELLGGPDGDDRSTLSGRDAQALESLIDGYVSDIDAFLRHRDDFYAPGYAYNIDRLREQLPPPPALMRRLQQYRTAVAGDPGGARPSTAATSTGDEQSPGEQRKATRAPTRRSMSRADYVRFLRAQNDVFAVSANQASVSLVQLTPYRGQDTVRGKFRCVNVGCRVDRVAWESDASVCDGAERCPRCSRWVYPYEQHQHSDGPT